MMQVENVEREALSCMRRRLPKTALPPCRELKYPYFWTLLRYIDRSHPPIKSRYKGLRNFFLAVTAHERTCFRTARRTGQPQDLIAIGSMDHLMFEAVRLHPCSDCGLVHARVESSGSFRQLGRVDVQAVGLRRWGLPQPVSKRRRIPMQ